VFKKSVSWLDFCSESRRQLKVIVCDESRNMASFLARLHCEQLRNMRATEAAAAGTGVLMQCGSGEVDRAPRPPVEFGGGEINKCHGFRCQNSAFGLVLSSSKDCS
jgi:hypothetical protein